MDRVRSHARHMPSGDAVRRAVDECIREGVLSEFLLAQKAEVIAMSIFEYDKEAEMAKIRRDEFELGWEAGQEKGWKTGHERGMEEGHKEGREEGGVWKLIQMTCKKLQRGKSVEEIAEELEETPEEIERICRAACAFAPEYDCDKIMQALRGLL